MTQEILQRERVEWNSMMSESRCEFHFSLDFFLEQPYI